MPIELQLMLWMLYTRNSARMDCTSKKAREHKLILNFYFCIVEISLLKFSRVQHIYLRHFKPFNGTVIKYKFKW